MEEAILIIEESVTLKEMQRWIAPVFKLTRTEDRLFSADMDNNYLFSITHGDELSTVAYSPAALKTIQATIKTPFAYLVSFVDFDLFKDCMLALWDNTKMIIDNDQGGLVTDAKTLDNLSSYYAFEHVK